MKILLAEDHTMLRIALTMALCKSGHVVTAVEDGQGLLDTLKRDSSYDLVVTDHNMPRMTGLEAIRRLREDSRFDRLPIILCSATDGKGIAEMKQGLKGFSKTYVINKSDLGDMVAEMKNHSVLAAA